MAVSGSCPAARLGLLALLLAVFGAGSAAAADPKSVASRIVYPPSPATAVIEWVSSVGKLSDVDPGRGKWKKILVGEGEKEPTLVAPTAVSIGPDDTLYIVDRRAGGIAIVNAKKKRFEIWKGEGSGRLAEPVGVAVSEGGDLYISDATHGVVFVYDAALRFRAALAPVKFRRLTALALSTDGKRLAVCDTAGHRVYVLDATDGKVLLTLGKGERSNEEGAFHTPVAVAYDEQGFLFVSDYLNFRIQVFDPDGGVELVFGTAGDRPGNLNRPRGLAADATAKVIYEVDAAFQLVQMFNFDGELLMWFGAPGDGPAQFQLPSGMARRGNLLAVTDTLNGRVQLFRFLGAPQPSVPPRPAGPAARRASPEGPPAGSRSAEASVIPSPTPPARTIPDGPAPPPSAVALATPAAAQAPAALAVVPTPAPTALPSPTAADVTPAKQEPPADRSPATETKPAVPTAPAPAPSGPPVLVTKDWAGREPVFAVRLSSHKERPSAEREATRLAAALHWPCHAVEVDLGASGVSYNVVLGEFLSVQDAKTLHKYLVARKTPGIGAVVEMKGP